MLFIHTSLAVLKKFQYSQENTPGRVLSSKVAEPKTVLNNDSFPDFPGNPVKLFRAAIFQSTETLVNTKVNRALPVASK